MGRVLNAGGNLSKMQQSSDTIPSVAVQLERHLTEIRGGGMGRHRCGRQCRHPWRWRCGADRDGAGGGAEEAISDLQ